MNSRLRIYVESLFDGVKRTKEVVELREEILQNVIDKYEDLIQQGKSEEEAYHIAVSGIGDIDDLLRSMGMDVRQDDGMDNTRGKFTNDSSMYQKEPESENKSEKEKEGRNSAFLLCGSVMLYILSVVPVIIADELGNDTVGVCFMFIMIAAATGMIILYGKTRPKYHKTNDSMVENFKEWNNNNAQNKEVYKSIRSAVWSVTTALYIIISFMTIAWHITWVIFLIAGAVVNVIKAYYDMKD